MPINGIGQFGHSRPPMSSITSSNADSTTVGACTRPSPMSQEPISAGTELPSTGTPVSLPSWLTIMVTAMPARYPMSTGLDSRSASAPALATQPSRHSTPTAIARPAAKVA
jgi:hypothetical protein